MSNAASLTAEANSCSEPRAAARASSIDWHQLTQLSHTGSRTTRCSRSNTASAYCKWTCRSSHTFPLQETASSSPSKRDTGLCRLMPKRVHLRELTPLLSHIASIALSSLQVSSKMISMGMKSGRFPMPSPQTAPATIRLPLTIRR